MPERVHRLGWVKGTYRIHPSLIRQRGKGGTAGGLNQRVLVPRLRRIDVTISRNDVIISREHDGHSRGQKLRGVGRQSAKPSELVVKFWTWLRIAVGRVERCDNNPIHCRFDVSALRVCSV